MLLIDAIYIHNGGGKILLDYLIDCLEKTNLKVHYLLDERIKNRMYNIKDSNHIEFVSSSFVNRYRFYKKNKKTFSKIFVLGNIPPLVKTRAVVYTYFHSALYLNQPIDYSFLEKLIFNIKIKIIEFTNINTDYWLVQTPLLKKGFIEKYKRIAEVLPFFPELTPVEKINREKERFLYVSNGHIHKNHSRLIKGFCKMYDAHKKGTLVLTINDDYPQVIDMINKARKDGYPIENIGFVDRASLIREYQKAEYIVYPSLTESFGLGLIEGISLGCKVAGADLPYTYAVCEPSLTFNPLEITAISDAFQKCLSTEEMPVSKAKVHNQIKDLIRLL